MWGIEMIAGYTEIQVPYVRCQTDRICGNKDSMRVLSAGSDLVWPHDDSA